MKKVEVKQLLAVDFFCCAGGVTSGFSKAGIKVLGGIDIDENYKETYEKNNRGSKFICVDIVDLQPSDLEKKLSIEKNMDNLIFVGCSPCQYYTSIQTDKSKSFEENRLLLDEFRRFVKYFNPGFIFIENVPGLETKDDSPLAKFKLFLTEKGYFFKDDVVNAADYNVPQNRRRYILIASRLTEEVTLPGKSTKKPITVKKAIVSLKPIPAGFRDEREWKHWTAQLKPINLKRLKHTAHNGGTRLAWKDNNELQLACYKGKDGTFPDVYGRMYWNQPSPTITTKFHSISNGRFGHPEQDRAISLREGAILQSFPRSYKFYSKSMVIIARMIGNAVPPELSKQIGFALIKNHKNASIQSQSKSH